MCLLGWLTKIVLGRNAWPTGRQRATSREKRSAHFNLRCRNVRKIWLRRFFSYQGGDFLSRQSEYEQMKRLHQIASSEDLIARTAPFQPETRADEYLAARKPEMLMETPEERIERLTVKEEAKRRESKKSIEEEVYKECTFQPKRVSNPKRPVRASTIEELVSNERGRMMRQDAEEAAELAFRKQCPFKPKTNSTTRPATRFSVDINDPKTVVRRISMQAMEKDAMLDQARKSKDYEEMKSCTFRPKTCPPPKNMNQPVVVRGLGRFLEVKDMARQKQEQMRERERKTFGSENGEYVKRPPAKAFHTTPQPFNLSTQNLEEKYRRQREHLEEMVREEREKDLTFKPKTNEAANREVLRKILEAGPQDYSSFTVETSQPGYGENYQPGSGGSYESGYGEHMYGGEVVGTDHGAGETGNPHLREYAHAITCEA
eukprot:Rmarinus@m.22318